MDDQMEINDFLLIFCKNSKGKMIEKLYSLSLLSFVLPTNSLVMTFLDRPMKSANERKLVTVKPKRPPTVRKGKRWLLYIVSKTSTVLWSGFLF